MEDSEAAADQSELFTVEDLFKDGGLFTVEAQVTEEALEDFLSQQAMLAHGAELEITQKLRPPSFMSVGHPVAMPLVDLLVSRGGKVPAEIRQQMQEHEFYGVQLACSFQPADSCRFHDATFAFELFHPDVGKRPHAADEPLAYGLWPQVVEEPVQVSHHYSFGPDLTFEFPPAKVTATPGELGGSVEYLLYQPRIEAYGLRESKAGWQFFRTKGHEIHRTQDLFLVLRKRKGTRVGIKFGLTARTEALISVGPVGPFPLGFKSRRPDNTPVHLPDVTTVLC